MEKLNELDQLVKQYKKKKDRNILDHIFKILYSRIIEKANYVFYEQTFNINNCKFKLVDVKKVELNDVIQELSLEIIEWINNFVPIAPFSHFLNQCLESNKWRPKFLDVDFIKNLNTQSIYQTNEEGEEENLADKISTSEPINVEFKSPLTKIEQEVWELRQEDLHLSQKEIAEELGVSQKTVSNVIASIKRKLQK